MIRNLRWYIVGLLMLSTTINYLDRQAFSVAAPALQARFGLSNADIALILNGFMLTYALMHPVAGRVIDRLGTRRGLALAVAWWSLANMAHALGMGVRSFAGLRCLLGVGAAGNFPAAIKAVSEWFPPRERTAATGVLNIGSGLGAVLAPPAVGLLVLRYGWESAFIATGGVGFIWVILWLGLYHPPAHHPRLSPKERDYILDGRQEAATAAGRGAWREALASRDLWVLMASRFIADPAWFVYLSWLPLYLSQVRGFSLEQIAWSAWVPYLGGNVGSVFGGILSARLIRRGFTVLSARKISLALCACVMPILIPAALAENPVTTLALLTIATFAAQAWAANGLTLPADLLPQRVVGLAYGLTGMCGMLSAAGFNWIVGAITGDPRGYLYVFAVVAFLHPLAAVIIILFLGRSGGGPLSRPKEQRAGRQDNEPGETNHACNDV